MAAGELPNGECGRRPHDRRNDRRQAASIRELSMENGVVFIELLAELLAMTSRPVRSLSASKRMLVLAA